MKRKKRLRRKEYLALERKKKDRQNKVLTGLFLALVFGGTAATFLVPKREFSDRENRALLLRELTRIGYSVVPPDGAFYLFMKALEPDANSFCARAKNTNFYWFPAMISAARAMCGSPIA